MFDVYVCKDHERYCASVSACLANQVDVLLSDSSLDQYSTKIS
jgi:hypothetical protein